MKQVQIKTWEEMEEEFELDPFGGFVCGGNSWTTRMEDAIPKNRIILIDNLTWIDSNGERWGITPQMIKQTINTGRKTLLKGV